MTICCDGTRSILCRAAAAVGRGSEDVGDDDKSAELMFAVCQGLAPVVQYAQLQHDSCVLLDVSDSFRRRATVSSVSRNRCTRQGLRGCGQSR